MKKILTLFLLLTSFSQYSFSQLNCNPQLGDKLLPSKPEIIGFKVEKLKLLNFKIKEKSIEKLVVISKPERNSVKVVIYKKNFFNNDFNSFFYKFIENKKDLENLINLVGSPEDFFEKNIFSQAFRKYAIQFHPDFEVLNYKKAESQSSNDTSFDEFSETVVDSSATDFIEKVDIENKTKKITEAEKQSSKVLDPKMFETKHFNPITNWKIDDTILLDSEVVDFFVSNKTQIKKLFSDSLNNYLRLTYNPELFINHGDTANFLNSDLKPNHHDDFNDSWTITGNSDLLIEEISKINSTDCSYRLNKHAFILTSFNGSFESRGGVL